MSLHYRVKLEMLMQSVSRASHKICFCTPESPVTTDGHFPAFTWKGVRLISSAMTITIITNRNTSFKEESKWHLSINQSKHPKLTLACTTLQYNKWLVWCGAYDKNGMARNYSVNDVDK